MSTDPLTEALAANARANAIIGQRADEMEALQQRVDELETVLHSVIDGCGHPDKAIRRVLLDLAPIRRVLNRPRKE